VNLHEPDELLGIWHRRQLDADIPRVRPVAHQAIDTGARVIGISESVSLSSAWALCWMDGSLLREAQSARERRIRIIGTLVKDATAAPGREPPTFFPVFDARETSAAIGPALRELWERYPHLVSNTWFLHDRDTGLIGARRLGA
jgi:hypothetical protein